MMPEMDGFEFEKLRENKEWLDIPVVVITAKILQKMIIKIEREM